MDSKLSFRNILSMLWGMMTSYRWRFYAGTVSRVISDLTSLLRPWILGMAVTYVTKFGKDSDVHYLLLLLGFLAGIIVVRMITICLSKYFLYSLAEVLAYDMGIKASKHVFSLDLSWQEKEQVGNKMSRIAKGSSAISTFIRTYEEVLIEGTINFIAISAIFFTFDWYFGVLIGIFFFSYYLFSYLITQKMKKIRREEEKRVEALSGAQFETMNALLTIKSLGLYGKIMHLLEKFRNDAQIFMYKRLQTLFTFRALVRIYEGFFQILIFGLAILAIINGKLEVGMIVVVVGYFSRISDAAEEYAQATNNLEMARVSLERLHEMLAVHPELESQGTEIFPAQWKKLEVRDLSFAFNGHVVLKNISFSIKRGEKIGIVGISGEGKSTLFKLLLKLYAPDSGEILFDGVSLKDIQRGSFTPHIAVVPQETEVLHFSMKENIALGELDPPPTRRTTGEGSVIPVKTGIYSTALERILKVSDISSYLHKLPEGVDTLVGEKGVKLSGGERQRLGIARALARKPAILLLDEATSHLDSESEKRILDGLEDYLKDTTLISIAHRLSTLKTMDRILVIKGGTLVEEGSFQKLKKSGGVFQKLWERQRGKE